MGGVGLLLITEKHEYQMVPLSLNECCLHVRVANRSNITSSSIIVFLLNLKWSEIKDSNF